MANWDIFLAGRLEVVRDLSTEAVRAGVAEGTIREDDLARPAGSSAAWVRVGDSPGLLESGPVGRSEEPGPSVGPAPETIEHDHQHHVPPVPPASGETIEHDRPKPAGALPPEGPGGPVARDGSGMDGSGEGRSSGTTGGAGRPEPENAREEPTVELPRRPAQADRAGSTAGGPPAGPASSPAAGAAGSVPSPGYSDPGAPPVADSTAPAISGLDEPEAVDPLDEDEEAAAFTLAAEPASEPDEVDLTAMVDVAFQLVLFFLVTATTLYFKTLEIPTPDPEDQESVAQQMRTLDELLEEYILVEIDPEGRVQVDREPIPVDTLTDRLRQIRSETLRNGMLLMADFTTPHRNAVSAIDSANALGLQIAIAKPSTPAE